VTAEVAVSLVVVVLAGLLVRSFTSLSSTEPGLDASNVLTFAITLPPAAYPESALVAEEHAGLVARIRAVPGVAAASGGTTLPFQGGYGQWDFQLDDRPPRQEGDRAWNAGIAWVQAGFFETLGIPLLAGRGIEPTDDAGAALVAVVSEAMARTYWPDLATSESGLRGVLGKRFGYASADGGVPWNTIVGVARDQRYIGLDEEPYPFVWLPHRQAQAATGGTPRTLRIAVRTARPPEALARSLRAAVADFDPDLPLSDVRTMEDAVTGTLAAVLAAVGIYGVISYSVAGRTREIGVRMALGAGRSDVMRLVVGEGARPVVLGVAIGLTVAWFGTGLVEAMLFGVTARDPLTFSALPAGLIAVGLAASALPALRATRIPPTESLRAD
jgi:predicted permease